MSKQKFTGYKKTIQPSIILTLLIFYFGFHSYHFTFIILFSPLYFYHFVFITFFLSFHFYHFIFTISCFKHFLVIIHVHAIVESIHDYFADAFVLIFSVHISICKHFHHFINFVQHFLIFILVFCFTLIVFMSVPVVTIKFTISIWGISADFYFIYPVQDNHIPHISDHAQYNLHLYSKHVLHACDQLGLLCLWCVSSIFLSWLLGLEL